MDLLPQLKVLSLGNPLQSTDEHVIADPAEHVNFAVSLACLILAVGCPWTNDEPNQKIQLIALECYPARPGLLHS